MIQNNCYNNGCTNFKSLKICSKCNIAKYCSRECQKINWNIHKNECSMYKHLAHPSSFEPNKCCYKPSCKKENAKQQCKICRVAVYCDKECRKSDYDNHQLKDCKVFYEQFSRAQHTWITEDPELANLVVCFRSKDNIKVLPSGEESINDIIISVLLLLLIILM